MFPMSCAAIPVDTVAHIAELIELTHFARNELAVRVLCDLYHVSLSVLSVLAVVAGKRTFFVDFVHHGPSQREQRETRVRQSEVVQAAEGCPSALTSNNTTPIRTVALTHSAFCDHSGMVIVCVSVMRSAIMHL
jgi:hypothetical protein